MGRGSKLGKFIASIFHNPDRWTTLLALSGRRVLVAGEPVVDEPLGLGELSRRHAQFRCLSTRQRVGSAIRLGKLASLVSEHIALRYALTRVVQQSEEELRFGLAMFGVDRLIPWLS
jgi:hypothetical protein